MKERDILRRLAWEYYTLSQQDRFIENRKLHKAVNDLKQIRPVVLIDELPWHEMNIGNELDLVCEHPMLRGFEWYLRSTIYKAKHLPADMVIRPYLPVQKVVHSSGIGITVDETTISTDGANHIVSHEFHDQLATEEDLEKIHDPVITYDEEETRERLERIGNLVGDLVPVRLTGFDYASSGTWDTIATFRGVSNLLIDLADRPEFMHKMVRKLGDANWSAMKQYEALNLFESDPESLHCTPILTDDLPGEGFDGRHVGFQNIWGRAFAQIFGSVSKEMHEEFDIDYIKDTIGQCGLVYYGCCEPLDKKIDIVEKIPHLRKISITPWADVHVAAEAIGKKYVLASKPNPASVAVGMLDKEALKKEIGTILHAVKSNGCSCDIVLKDISTCSGRPENIFEWEQIVTGMVRNY